ncbi:hypothetical protein CERSUDRAFT_118292 [Gelatoporia subvermispora B]|uniref:Uncharacterized protein n=1 Tax=Ceriporiopsis subvermispora (strain B) TaxID=914234 RepID=M2R4W7_CERS8|nr:hypothetical protein CERSUDRAFT_118292 [Gelatoporia subvermispora B]
MGKKSYARADILGNCIVTVEALKDSSSAISSVPFMGAIFAAALGLLRTIEKVNDAQDRGMRLAQQITHLIEHIDKSIAQDVGLMDTNLNNELNLLADTLRCIRIDLEKQRTRKFYHRLLRISSISSKLADYQETLNSSWHSFDACWFRSLGRKLEKQAQHGKALEGKLEAQEKLMREQALYDEHQFRLFRWCDLRLRDERGKWYLSDTASGSSLLAEWQGGAVEVRRFQVLEGTTGKVCVLCPFQMPSLAHPRVAQVLGYSNPGSQERFYVMTTGTMSLTDCLRINDTKTRLRVWLQTIHDCIVVVNEIRQTYQPRPPTDIDHTAAGNSDFRVDTNDRLILNPEQLWWVEPYDVWRFWLERTETKFAETYGNFGFMGALLAWSHRVCSIRRSKWVSGTEESGGPNPDIGNIIRALNCLSYGTRVRVRETKAAQTRRL